MMGSPFRKSPTDRAYVVDLANKRKSQRKLGEIGWGVNQFRSQNKAGNNMPKPCVRGFDKKNLNNFCDHSGYFANTLDKNLGFGYSDKLSIRDMR